MIIKLLDINNNVITYKEFNTHSYYDGIYNSLAIENKVIELDEKYYENSFEGLKLRRSLVLTIEQKQLVREKVDLDNLMLLNYIDNDALFLDNNELKKYRNLISGLKYGNLEDINDFFEENENLLCNSYCIISKGM